MKKCVECGTEESSKWYFVSKGTPMCCKCYSKNYRKANPSRVKNTLSKYASSEKGKNRHKKYAKSEKGRESSNQRNFRYKLNHPEKVKAYQSSERRRKLSREQYIRKKNSDPAYYVSKRALRRAKEKESQPEWVNREEILEIYQQAEELQWLSEEQLEVDHIIPLINDKVCGLHVSWNLQIVPMSLNRQKGNRFDGTKKNLKWREEYESLL